jgi:hypothetical protein
MVTEKGSSASVVLLHHHWFIDIYGMVIKGVAHHVFEWITWTLDWHAVCTKSHSGPW